MRDLYNQLVADGEPAIQQLRAERRQENVALEFKTKSNPGTGEPSRDDRRNLGIALSAFSNSMGGLIVWGITAKEDADGVDCATELQPIAETVTARFPYLILSCVRGANVQPQVKYTSLRFGVELRADRGGYHFAGSADDVIHPELTLPVSQLLTPEIRVFPRRGGQSQIPRGSVQPVTVAYQCGCYNSRPTAGEFTISDDQLVERGIEGGFIY
jgi:hypothetical protein